MLVKNSPFSFLYNRFDFIVRFLYSQTSLGLIVSKIFVKNLYESDPNNLNQVFEEAKRVWDKHKLSVKNKNILEIGPGTSLITTINFLTYGSKKVYLLDKYPRFDSTTKLKPSTIELSYFSKFKTSKFLNKSGYLKNQFVKFHQKDLSDYKNKADIIFTKSVLEHVKNPDQFISQTFRTLKPKGFAYHWIDLRDHYNFDKPFLFYKYPDWLWQKYLTKPGRSYTNRFRHHQFISSFKRAGFKIVWKKTAKEKLTTNHSLTNDFKKMPRSSLEVTILEILVQKP